MTRHVTSADGTQIAFDLLGEGTPLIVIGGLLCDRQRMRDLAEQFAKRFSVINYDRRGRGASGDTAPYALDREVEDLAALIAEAGGSAAVYGHSSGAGLALNAAASGLPITRLVLHEPPYGPDDAESARGSRDLAEGVRAALAGGGRAEAIAMFFAATGMPPEVADEMAGDPHMQAMAPTMVYDFEVMGDFACGGVIPKDLVRAIKAPTLVVAGETSPDFFRDTAAALAAILPNAQHVLLEGHDHAAPAEVVAPVVGAFLTA
ncbi:alpha/beta hydrolase [Phenylobacterium sp.]|uniref:alpha/beta fold hydrolase n=1 Tax=Phenylobacterium sp. TaxID=1871053 RepID=UPI00286CE795|nr:alpha/beta hydrolase [Phenylobacterium sp.]